MSIKQDINFDNYDRESLNKINKRRQESDCFINVFNNLTDIEVSETEARKELRGIENFLNRKLEISGENNKENIVKYSESIEINSNGVQVSNKLIEMNEEQLKDPVFMLNAHGYSEKSFELLNVKNNFWNVYSKKDGVQTLYSSKITVKPIIQEFDIEWAKEIFEELPSLKPVKKYIDKVHKSIIEIQYADLHIGLQGCEYEEELNDMTDRIISKFKHADIFLIPMGQDLLNSNHTVNSASVTVKGTIVESNMSYSEMFKSGLRVYCHIVDRILEQTDAVIDMPYILGNHDKHSAFGVYQSLMQRYRNNPNIKFDDSMKPRKYRGYGVNGIGLGHGQSEGKRITGLFQTEASSIFANSKFVEFHLSHLHSEKSFSENGITFRRLPTVNKPDEWHNEKGFVGATNRIQVFEYDYEIGLESINYFTL